MTSLYLDLALPLCVVGQFNAIVLVVGYGVWQWVMGCCVSTPLLPRLTCGMPTAGAGLRRGMRAARDCLVCLHGAHDVPWFGAVGMDPLGGDWPWHALACGRRPAAGVWVGRSEGGPRQAYTRIPVPRAVQGRPHCGPAPDPYDPATAPTATQVQFPPEAPAEAAGAGGSAGEGEEKGAQGGEVRPCLVPFASLMNHGAFPHVVHFSRVDPATGCLR